MYVKLVQPEYQHLYCINKCLFCDTVAYSAYYMYVCIYFLLVEGKSLQIQHKYFNINIVYPALRGLSTTFNTKQYIKLSSMTQYISTKLQLVPCASYSLKTSQLQYVLYTMG